MWTHQLHPFICLPSSHKPKQKRGRELKPHHHAKCLQIVFFSWGLLAVRMGCHAKAVDLCMTCRPYGVAHGPPLINKWRAHPRGQPSSAGPFVAAISRLTGIQNGHTLRLPVRRLLTLSLVMGRRAGMGRDGGLGGGAHKGGTWVALLPSPLLISVSDKVKQRVHSGLHNKSIRE